MFAFTDETGQQTPLSEVTSAFVVQAAEPLQQTGVWGV